MEKKDILNILSDRIESLNKDKQKPEYKDITEWLNGHIDEVNFLIKVFEE